MKKKQKKSKKNKKIKKKVVKKKRSKKFKKFLKKRKKTLKNKIQKVKKRKTNNFKKRVKYPNVKRAQKDSLILKLVKLQLSLKSRFDFKINLNLEKYIQGFFDKISESISNYKILKGDEKRRLQIEKIENEKK